MKTISITLDDETQKALEWDILDLDLWARNALFNKARRCADAIIALALEDTDNIILTQTDKQQLRTYLDNQGILIPSIKELPDNIKKEIIKRANIKSAAERQAELESEMNK